MKLFFFSSLKSILLKITVSAFIFSIHKITCTANGHYDGVSRMLVTGRPFPGVKEQSILQ